MIFADFSPPRNRMVQAKAQIETFSLTTHQWDSPICGWAKMGGLTEVTEIALIFTPFFTVEGEGGLKPHQHSWALIG